MKNEKNRKKREHMKAERGSDASNLRMKGKIKKKNEKKQNKGNVSVRVSLFCIYVV